MLKIKIIKKNKLDEQKNPVKTKDESLPPQSTRRGTVETVENWVADWRKQTEIKTRLAVGELAQLKFRNPTGM